MLCLGSGVLDLVQSQVELEGMRFFSPTVLRSTVGEHSLHLDFVGLDFYPNYVIPWPVGAKQLSKRVKNYKKWSGKPVILAETGYPSQGYGHRIRWQAEFIKQIVPIAREETIGMIYLHLTDKPRSDQVPENLPVTRAWDPMYRIEPYWGVFDRSGNPKTETVKGETINVWETFKSAIKAAESDRSAGSGASAKKRPGQSSTKSKGNPRKERAWF